VLSKWDHKRVFLVVLLIHPHNAKVLVHVTFWNFDVHDSLNPPCASPHALGFMAPEIR